MTQFMLKTRCEPDDDDLDEGGDCSMFVHFAAEKKKKSATNPSDGKCARNAVTVKVSICSWIDFLIGALGLFVM